MNREALKLLLSSVAPTMPLTASQDMHADHIIYEVNELAGQAEIVLYCRSRDYFRSVSIADRCIALLRATDLIVMNVDLMESFLHRLELYETSVTVTVSDHQNCVR